MKKKELLIIFVLAVLVTVMSAILGKGWPFGYLYVGVGVAGGLGTGALIIDFGELNFVLDLLFWCLVLAALYHVGYRVTREGWQNDKQNMPKKLKTILGIIVGVIIGLAVGWLLLFPLNILISPLNLFLMSDLPKLWTNVQGMVMHTIGIVSVILIFLGGIFGGGGWAGVGLRIS